MSALLNFIKENPEDWEAKINEMDINTYWDDRFPNLCIFKYKIDADFTNPICMECRGHIVDIKNLKFVCRPFDKFFEYTEELAPEIEWPATATEKMDGTMINFWYYEDKNRWVFATQRFISCDDSMCLVSGNEGPNKTFHDLVCDIIDDEEFELFDSLNENITYMFELTSPDNQVVIHYNEPRLWFLNARNNETGEYIEQDYLFDNSYSFKTLAKHFVSNMESILEQIKDMNKTYVYGKNPVIDHIKHEGFVLTDYNNNRVKVKCEEWLMLHGAFNNGVFRKKYVVPLLLNYNINMNSVIKDMPHYEAFLLYYKFRVAEFKRNVTTSINIARTLYKKYNGDMKILGPRFKKCKYSAAMFNAITNTKTPDQIIDSLKESYILGCIEEYEPLKVAKEIYAKFDE